MNPALETLEKLNKEYLAMKAHDSDYVVTRIEGDNPDGSKTVNFYFSLTIPAAEAQKPKAP